jgi:exopolyphosphatase/guanosine-5'-triphosphate,3'-diphosphate pyrophosphatase
MIRLGGKKDEKRLSRKQIKRIYRNLLQYSCEDRIRIMGLRPDRADVIIPAAEIYLAVMNWAGISDMYVPQIGLSDGIVRILYEKFKLLNR